MIPDKGVIVVKTHCAVALCAVLTLCLAGCASTAPEKDATPTTVDRSTSTTLSTTEVITTTTTKGIPDAIQNAVQPEPQDADFVKIRDYIPDIIVELRYATADNFTGQVIYEFEEAWLRYGTVKKLMAVQEALRPKGVRLKIWDAFRPTAAQFTLWDVCPNPTYVANPNGGYSSHSRGNTVDLTLVYEDGTECVMPTVFDDFSTFADRDYSDCSEESAANARLLEDAMQTAGFSPYYGEWWHFSDTQLYAAEEVFCPTAATDCVVNCEEYLCLRTAASVDAATIVEIAVGETCTVVAECGEFSLVEYYHLRGYVLAAYLQPC